VEPWYRSQSSAWPLILARLPRPLLEEEAVNDLRFLANELVIGRIERMPGTVLLGQRWGWKRTKIERILKSDWRDPYQQPTNSRPTADQQPTNSCETLETNISKEKKQPTNSRPTADQQPTNMVPEIVQFDSELIDVNNKPLNQEQLTIDIISNAPAIGGYQYYEACRLMVEERHNTAGDTNAIMSDADKKAIDRWRKKYDIKDFQVVWDYFCSSESFESKAAKESKWLRWSSIANDKFPSRVDTAWKWDEEGRKDLSKKQAVKPDFSIIEKIRGLPDQASSRYMEALNQIPHWQEIASLRNGSIVAVYRELCDPYRANQIEKQIQELIKNVA